MRDIINLNSYSTSISNTGIINWLTKLLLVRHINEDPIDQRHLGDWTSLWLQKLYSIS